MSTNLLGKAAEWVATQTKAHTADDLTITRTGFDPVPVRGTQGKKEYKIQEPGQPVVIVESDDFLILAADYVIDGNVSEPVEDDVITRIRSGKQERYRVLSPGDEIPVYEYSDFGKTQLRVHTKFHDEEAVT